MKDVSTPLCSEPLFMAFETHVSHSSSQGSFRWGTRGNAVPIIKVFKNAKNALYIAGFCIYNIKIFTGVIPLDFRKLGPRYEYSLGSPAFPLFLLDYGTAIVT